MLVRENRPLKNLDLALECLEATKVVSIELHRPTSTADTADVPFEPLPANLDDLLISEVTWRPNLDSCAIGRLRYTPIDYYIPGDGACRTNQRVTTSDKDPLRRH